MIDTQQGDAVAGVEGPHRRRCERKQVFDLLATTDRPAIATPDSDKTSRVVAKINRSPFARG